MGETDTEQMIAKLKFDEQGLIPAIVQDVSTGRVLTLAYMNRETVEMSLRKRETYFWSRSRKKIWHKGETSGNVQKISKVEADCDGDALLVMVEPQGPACHTGATSCFFTEFVSDEAHRLYPEVEATVNPNLSTTIEKLIQVIKRRKADMPQGSYTAYLFSKGTDKILKKIGEESAETIVAAKNKSKIELARESADLLYHLLVLFVNEGLEVGELLAELERRAVKKTEGSQP
jgi:phosphoribosyl-AMP cyclohydrolase / phosphoribosyl-ATP pyrophosphohydrolase